MERLPSPTKFDTQDEVEPFLDYGAPLKPKSTRWRPYILIGLAFCFTSVVSFLGGFYVSRASERLGTYETRFKSDFGIQTTDKYCYTLLSN